MSILENIASIHDLDLSWHERFQEGTASPLKYYNFMKLFAEKGEHQFRREGSFLAVPLTGLKVWTTNTAGGIEKKAEQDGKPLILRFDNDRYAALSDRRKALGDIYRNAAERRLTQANLNNPDFMGPDIWTWTDKQWGKERPHLVEVPGQHAKYVFTEEGWKKTSRVVVSNADGEATAFSYDWGTFEFAPNGDIAGYAHEFEALKDSLRAINGEYASIVENNKGLDEEQKRIIYDALIIKHLFTLHEKGFYVTTYDVYPQNPGFAKANFHSQADHEKARAGEANLFRLFGQEARRIRAFGPPGWRSNVPTVAEIDIAVAKLLRQQPDGPPQNRKVA